MPELTPWLQSEMHAHMKRLPLILLLVLAWACTGCAVGYRHQWGQERPYDRGVSADVNHSADVFYAGVVFDFRFIRFLTPQEEFIHDETFVDDLGGRSANHGRRTQRMLRVDVPVLSVWTPKDGAELKYPPTMKMRDSLEFVVGGDIDLEGGRTMRVDGAIAYQHSQWAGLRAFGGWHWSNYHGSTRSIDQPVARIWDGTVDGPQVGVELTMFAGEYALQVVEWLIKKDERYRKQYGD